MLWPPNQMTFEDKNQSWQPPENYKFYGACADGSFLRVEYRQIIFKTGTRLVIAKNIVVIYVNDQGREVARTFSRVSVPQTVEVPTYAPVARRFRIKNGFLLGLQGIQEMFR